MFLAGAIAGPLDIQISHLDQPSSHLPEAILGFAGTAIWGFLALVALILFRKSIAKFLSTVGGRLTKLSFGGFELELNAAAQSAMLSDDARQFGSMDSQALASSSTSQTLVRALQGEYIPNSYAVLDLGAGQSWLVSRLFIFAIMLREVRGVRCFVFVDRGRVPDEFLGTISTEDIRHAVARSTPWLERVYAKAYRDRLWQTSAPDPMASARSLNTDFAAQVIQEFVALLKTDMNWSATAGIGAASTPGGEPTFTQFQSALSVSPTVKLGNSTEYGTWINRNVLFEIFREVLHLDQVRKSAGANEKMREVLTSESAFVAVVHHGRFVSLIDRAKALEEFAKTRIDEDV